MSKDYTFKAVPKSVVENAFNKALFAAREQIITDCTLYTKWLGGDLKDSVQHSITKLTLSISWNTPYARKQWFTGQPSATSLMHHPKACIKWAEQAELDNRDVWIKQLEDGMADNL